MDLQKLNKILDAEPKFRKKQVWHFIFEKLITSWGEATSLPKKLREDLEDNCSLDIVSQITGDDNVKKALVTFQDGLAVETVLLQHEDGRNTVCVSCQVGCAMGCEFCATGTMGIQRNLTSWEIVEQILLFSRLLKKQNEKVTNIVFMGMGEPMMNYEEVLGAIKFLNSQETLNLGARRFSISTVGVVDGINKLAREDLDVNLAISLHATTDELRSKLMPVNKKWPIKKLLQTVDAYIKAKKRRVMFEYVLIKGINDDLLDADRLISLLKGKMCFVNLIIYNKTQLYSPPDKIKVKRFKEKLANGGLDVIQRFTFGNKIEAACGQLLIKKKEA